MGKKFSERKRKAFRLEPSDFNGEKIWLNHIDETNIKQIQKIIKESKDDSIKYGYEMLKALVIGEDFEIDLDINNKEDKKIIKEVLTNPDDTISKILIEIYKMVLEQCTLTYEIDKPLQNIDPKLKKKIIEMEKQNREKKKTTDEMNADELREYIKQNNLQK